jgi:putative glutamine amidotransferase
MKDILVSPRLEFINDTHEERVSLDTNWFSFLNFCGLNPIIYTYDDIDLYKISGIILTGGNDLNIFNPTEQNKKRDLYEYQLIKMAIKTHIPLLGVCRGAQLISYYYGSTLDKINDHVRVNHKVFNTNQSKVLGYKLKHTEVNSYHNFTVKNLGNDLTSLCICSEGSIEAFEHKHKKILGIMWHPERYNQFVEEDVLLVKKVFGVK